MNILDEQRWKNKKKTTTVTSKFALTLIIKIVHILSTIEQSLVIVNFCFGIMR